MRKEMIESYIIELKKSLGEVRAQVGRDELQALYNKKDYVGMISCVKKSLRLELCVSVELVNSEVTKYPNSPAWIRLPETIPLYGTYEFRQTEVTIHLRKSFLNEAHFEQIVVVIAHELCHVVLDAIMHTLRRKEEAVDLAAMLLGFREIFVDGSESVYEIDRSLLGWILGYRNFKVRHVGYLTLEEVQYAASVMTPKTTRG